MAEVKVIKSERVPSLAEGRRGKDDLLIVYQTADGANHLIRMPADGTTPQSLQAAIKKDIEERSLHVGMTFNV